MTLGEKMKIARTECGLSQEELAKKLCVSRSAVAKWESDRGLPDVEILKLLAKLLHISVDALLDNEESVDTFLIREPIDLSLYGKKGRKKRKDKLMSEKFPDAEIFSALGRVKLTKAEKFTDNLLGFLTNAPFGIPDFLNEVKNLDKQYYFVYQNGNRFLVLVTDTFMEIRRLHESLPEKKFTLGNMIFIKSGRLVK